MKIKAISFTMALMMMISVLFTGCGEEKPYAYEDYESLGTINGETIDFRFVYFCARYEQACLENYYYEAMGPEMWEQEVEAGKTFEESVKASILADLQDLLVLELFAEKEGIKIENNELLAIRKAAEEFMKDNSEEAIAKMGATKEIVERYLSLYTIFNKMYEHLIADADIDFELEEYKRSTASYILLPKDKYNMADALDVLEQCKADKDAITVKGEKLKVTTVTYGSDGPVDVNITPDIFEILKELETGEVHDVVLTSGNNYMIVKMVEELDAEASAKVKEALIEEAQTKLYDEAMEKYKKEVTFVINEKAWAAITFDLHFALVRED